MEVVNYTSSEDQDIRCATCGRMVKRAVALSGRPGFHGLDCAARLLGKPRTKRGQDDVELAGLRAWAKHHGQIYGERARAQFGSLPRRGAFPSFTAYGEFTRGALTAVGGPLPERVSFKDTYWEAFIDAFSEK